MTRPHGRQVAEEPKRSHSPPPCKEAPWLQEEAMVESSIDVKKEMGDATRSKSCECAPTLPPPVNNNESQL